MYILLLSQVCMYAGGRQDGIGQDRIPGQVGYDRKRRALFLCAHAVQAVLQGRLSLPYLIGNSPKPANPVHQNVATDKDPLQKHTQVCTLQVKLPNKGTYLRVTHLLEALLTCNDGPGSGTCCKAQKARNGLGLIVIGRQLALWLCLSSQSASQLLLIWAYLAYQVIQVASLT